MAVSEAQLLQAAGGGDEDAYRRLLEPYRHELQAHCYRMLGSVQDAEDALQETSLRAWRGLGSFERRSSLRSWLYTIATNTCLNLIAARKNRVLPMDFGPSSGPAENPGEPIVESVWIEPYPEAEEAVELRESVELAFVAALQHLPVNQRAVLILREVLGFSAQEAAETLDTSVASVNSALQRARKAVDEKLPDQTQQETLREIGDNGMREIVEGYMDAMSRGDVNAVIDLLAEDAAWSMPPLASWYRGHEALAGFLRIGPLNGNWRWRHLPASSNGQAAIGSYTWREDEGAYRPFALDVLTVGPDRKIREVTSFIVRTAEERTPERIANYPDEAVAEGMVADVFERAGLPAALPAV